MQHLHDRLLAAARNAIINGKPIEALEKIDAFVARVGKIRIDSTERARLESHILELRILAEAAQQGAQSALDQIRAIVHAARSLQTYDSGGKLHINMVTQDPARRF